MDSIEIWRRVKGECRPYSFILKFDFTSTSYLHKPYRSFADVCIRSEVSFNMAPKIRNRFMDL